MEHSSLIDQFIQTADTYAAITEVEDGLESKRKALFNSMILIWQELGSAGKAQVSGHLVKLHRESKLSLGHEPVFAVAFKNATAARKNEQRSSHDERRMENH